jgi:fibronectin type 3 domain-containing protein
MFEHHPKLVTLRGFTLVVCLALLAGCLPKTTPPAAAPDSLVATAGDASVSLTWTASSGATSYNVKRSTTTGGPFTQVAAPTLASYTDSSLTNGTTYYYVVSAVSSAGESANSAQASATPAAAPPPVPINLTATPGNATVSLAWTASSGATTYNVKRATTSGGPYTQIATPTSPSYTDSALTNGTTYYYVVAAVNAAGESSANSTQVSAKPVAPSAPPPVPANLVATAGDSSASLAWTASSGATSYHVKRATTSGGPYTQIAAPTSPAYSDLSLTNGTTYYYVVSAVNAAGESANSTQASAAPSGPPPTNFGVWTNVSPSGVDLVSTLCSNYGAKTVQVDPVHPSNLYTSFDCQGVWKSIDYGSTWTGPINTGTNGAAVSACSGGLTIAPSSTANVPTIYQSCIRGGNGLGFWKSVDGGVNWTQIVVTPTSRQDYYPPVADPYDAAHLLMIGHEFDSVVESVDAGQTWTSVPLAGGMMQVDHSPAIFFIDTGTAGTTRGTWLWIGDQTGGNFGTWRTTNGGTAWVQVDKNEHVGDAQIYQPDKSGVVYMSGNYSVHGPGVLRSNDYGQTWAHVGLNDIETVVVGTSKNVYAMFGFPVGVGGSINPAFAVASQPGTGTWVEPGTPAALSVEGAAQIGVTNDGTHSILVGAMWNSGVWRYIEP